MSIGIGRDQVEAAAITEARAHDPVKRPVHYNWLPGVECKDVVRHFSFNIGCAIKYLWRHGRKGPADEDLAKAVEYIEDERRRLRGDHAQGKGEG